MRILLADDHGLVRDAIGALLQKDDPEAIVIKTKDLPSAITALRQDGPYDVIILDMRMPGMNGLSGIADIKKISPDTPIMIMSGNASTEDVHAALEMGAKGFVPKTLAGRSLINAVRLVAGGDSYVPIDVFKNSNTSSSQGLREKLTKRETEVLAQLRQGHSNKEIARALTIAEATVKLHIRSLSKKFSARNRTDIIIRAIDAGVL